VLGIGNPILSDDGVGVLVAEAVRTHLPDDTPIDITEVSVGGLSLMEAMVGFDRVILVDAYQSENGKPGTIHKLSPEDLDAVTQLNTVPLPTTPT
jgi:hydrogenase maturation protease